MRVAFACHHYRLISKIHNTTLIPSGNIDGNLTSIILTTKLVYCINNFATEQSTRTYLTSRGQFLRISASEQAIVMEGNTSLNSKTMEVLRQIRSYTRQISQKQKALEKVIDGIASDEAKSQELVAECETMSEGTSREEKYDEVARIAPHLRKLDEARAKLNEDIRYQKLDLVDSRERLEEELWLALVQSGQVEADDAVSDVASDPFEALNEGGPNLSYDYDGNIGHGSDPDAVHPDVMDHDGDADRDPTQKAMSLLDVTKEELQVASMSFYQYDRLCKEQRQEFEADMVPEWRGMSRTEFDLEQLSRRIDLTRELVRAERAYSEAGRYAVEVGLMREDSDQSCHFVEYPDDGACSGDRYAVIVEEKDTSSIEAWVEGFPPTFSTSPVSAQGDEWDVDSVRFGEGCSTHADEWNKPKINRMEQLRALERENLGRVGIITYPDEMMCQHLPGYAYTASGAASAVSVSQCEEGDSAALVLWKPSFAIMKELVVSGQAAVARISATWSNRQGGGI
jgi:hypothetical protein